MKILLLFYFLFAFRYEPDIKIITHENCVYSQALIALLDWSGTKYLKLDAVDHMNLLKKNKSIPKVFVNKKLIGGYKDSLKKWTFVFKKLPSEPNFNVLFDPEYVIAKYGQKASVKK